VSITRRVPWLAFLIVLLTGGAFPLGWHLYVFLTANFLLVGLVVLDRLLTPPGKSLTVTWLNDENKDNHLFFKTDNTLQFLIHNHSGYRLWVQALGGMGENGRFFAVTASDMVHFIEPGKNQIFSYTTLPAKRGAFRFEEVFLRYRGVLGFCVRQVTMPLPVDLKVYPNIRDVSKFRLMMQKSRLLPMGDKMIRHFGNGSEFESLRSYVEGDDYRKINWPATARENKLMVNQYQVERNQPVYILLDTARPMSYSVNGFKKLDYAINAALILCDIVNQQGDQAGLLSFDSRVNAHVKPGKGPAHRNTLMETLYHIEGNRETADYEGAFRRLCEMQKRRSLVFVFTDFEIIEEAEALIAQMAMLRKKHMPIVVFMANESLNALVEAPAFGYKARVLQDTAREFQTERTTIFKQLHAMRIPNVESPAESFAVAAVNRYIQITRG